MAAAVILTEGAVLDVEALRSFCREQLTAYKVPRSIVAVPELPARSSARCCAGWSGSNCWPRADRSPHIQALWTGPGELTHPSTLQTSGRSGTSRRSCPTTSRAVRSTRPARRNGHRSRTSPTAPCVSYWPVITWVNTAAATHRLSPGPDRRPHRPHIEPSRLSRRRAPPPFKEHRP